MQGAQPEIGPNPRQHQSQPGRRRAMIDLTDYPGVQTDCTIAFNRALRDASAKGETIRFPPGRLLFRSRPNPMGCGIFLQGEGGITSAKLGTMVLVDYDEPDPEKGFFTWDGTDPRGYKGTGGGIAGMSLYRLGGTSGGTALRLTCTNNKEYRAGWWSLQNVAVLAENKSTWDHCLYADGTKVGPEGIRWLNLQGFMASGAINGSVVLDTVLHFNWNGGQVQGGHTVDPHQKAVGVYILGKSQDIHLSGVSIYGNLNIHECEQFTFTGLAKWIWLEGLGRVRRGIINAVGCDRLENNATPTADKVLVTVV
jgi:hypothetical protein